MKTVNATRMNLLLKKEEVNTAKTGAGLLRDKRDVLLKEFFSSLKFLLQQRGELESQSYEATKSLVYSLGLEGRERLRSMSFIRSSPPSPRINYKNIWGIKVPEIVIEDESRPCGETQNKKDNDMIEPSLFLQETKKNFHDFLILALRILPQELKLKRIGQEIKNTTRKVNSLEKYIIPQLHFHVKYIQEALEEREREDIFRLKRLKRGQK